MKKLFAGSTFVVAAIGLAALFAFLLNQTVPPTEAAGPRWPDNEIPFYIDEHVNDDHRNAIYQAVAIWQQRTALHFIELDAWGVRAHAKNYLHYIDRGSQNHSYKFKDIKDDDDLDAFPYLQSGDWVVKFIDCGSSCSGPQEQWGDNYHV